ncbi:MAG: hypothetical protein ABEH78_01130 [Haloferacaceae archaeon]
MAETEDRSRTDHLRGRAPVIRNGSGIGLLRKIRPHLWAVAIVFFGIGDTVTTTVGLQAGHIAEVGPVVAPIIQQYGYAAIGLLKLGTLVACYLVYRIIPAPHNLGVPLGLAVLGVLVSGWNAVVLTIALG